MNQLEPGAPSIHRRGDFPAVFSFGARPGFTLVEVIAVMMMAAIMAAVAVGSLNSLPASRVAGAGRMVQRDLSYARERSMATGTRHWVLFAPANDSFSVLAENPASPGRTGALTITDPATGQPFVERMNINEYAGVDLTSASFDGASEVGFDWLGRPVNSTQNPLAANGVVILGSGGGATITVGAGNGMVTFAGP